MRGALILGITLAAAAGVPAAAQDGRGEARADGLAGALAACRAIGGNAERLACFDKAAAALLSAKDDGQVVILDREGMRRAKRRVFGFQLPRLGLFGDGRDDEGKGEPEVKEIDSTITRVVAAGGGTYILGLADGSTWQTTEGRTNFVPRRDEAVKIEVGILGSYNLKVAGSNRSVKAKRVR